MIWWRGTIRSSSGRAPAPVVACGVAVALLALAAGPRPAAAQIMVSRGLMPAMLDDTAARPGFLSGIYIFGEVQRGFGSTGEEEHWNAKLGAGADIYRWGARTALVALTVDELTANPFSDTHFNPRGIRLEEALMLIHRRGGLDWQLGAFWRCKHDIDNAESPFTYVSTAGREHAERNLIAVGGQAGVLTGEIPLGARTTVRALVRGEINIHRSDTRHPVSLDPPRAERGVATTYAGIRLAHHLSHSVSAYSRAWASLLYLTPDHLSTSHLSPQLNDRAELGVRMTGARGGLDTFAAYEHFYDDLSGPVPQRSNVVFVGLRLSSAELF